MGCMMLRIVCVQMLVKTQKKKLHQQLDGAKEEDWTSVKHRGRGVNFWFIASFASSLRL